MVKPDFTGTWKFNPNRSLLQIPAPESTVFVIEHNEPYFRLERTHVFDGKSDTFSIDLTTNGEAVALASAGFEIQASLRWEGDALLFDSRLERQREHATNLVRYRLSDDGQTFTAEERFRGSQYSYENKWVFDKQ
jgi:hypothetical protein